MSATNITEDNVHKAQSFILKSLIIVSERLSNRNSETTKDEIQMASLLRILFK
jgi:hypothetical protein